MKFYISNINNYEDNYYLKYYKKLNNYQKSKLNKLKNDKDKKLSLIGLILISNKLGIDINKILYKKRKPYIKNNNIFISISHKYPYTAVIINDKPIGIDLEIKRELNKNINNYLNSNSDLESLIKWTKYESSVKNNNKKLKNITIIINKKIIVSINT